MTLRVSGGVTVNLWTWGVVGVMEREIRMIVGEEMRRVR